MRAVLQTTLAALCLGGLPAQACSGPGTTQVDAIYPSGPVVPDNILRLYLYFTAPMSDAEILPHLTLTRSDGTIVEGAFLSNRFDLWSPDRTRLTLLFDPSRVKTGLEAHIEQGRALDAGESYTFTVEAGALDAAGCGLADRFSHRFTAAISDVDPPDPGLWDIAVPQAGTTEALSLGLGSAHDHLSMAFRIRVRHADGAVVPGQVDLAEGETRWLFHPSMPWADADHAIWVEPELEDLAGNRPGQLFDQPIGLVVQQPDLRLQFRPTIE